MNISDIERTYKEQPPVIVDDSKEAKYSKKEQKAIVDILLTGAIKIKDLAKDFDVTVKSIREWAKGVPPLKITKAELKAHSDKKDLILNLAKLCKPTEIAQRTGTPVKVVVQMTKDHEKARLTKKNHSHEMRAPIRQRPYEEWELMALRAAHGKGIKKSVFALLFDRSENSVGKKACELEVSFKLKKE